MWVEWVVAMGVCVERSATAVVEVRAVVVVRLLGEGVLGSCCQPWKSFGCNWWV